MSEDKYQRFSDRFFQVSPLYTKPGWYLKLREGNVIGPYPNRSAAQAALFSLFGITDSDGTHLLQDAPIYSENSRRDK